MSKVIGPSRPDEPVGAAASSRRLKVRPWVFLLALALCMLGVGNLVFPPDLREQLPVDYLLVCVPLCGAAMLFNPARVVKNNAAPVLLVMFFLAMLPGFFVAPLNPYGVSKALAIGIAMILLAAPSAFTSTMYGVRITIRILLVLGGAISVLLLVSGGEFVFGRQSLFGLNPIGIARVTALFLALGVPLLFIRYTGDKATRAFLFVGTPLALLATVETGSRGPLLSAVVSIAVAFLIVLARRRVGPGTIAIVAGAGVAAFVVLSFFANAGLDRITQGSDSGRYDLYQLAFRIFLEHPNGVGWGNFAQYAPGFPTVDGYILYPHNLFLELAVEGGLAAVVGGFALVGVTVLRLIRVGLQTDNPWPLIVLAFLLYAIVNAQVSSDIVGNRMLWLALGLALVRFPKASSPEPPLALPPSRIGRPSGRARRASRGSLFEP